MKKCIILSLVFLFGCFFFIPQPIRAQMGPMMDDGDFGREIIADKENHGETIESVLSELLAKHQVSIISELDCDKLSDEDFERLGDAVMEQQHPGEAHEAMDQMIARLQSPKTTADSGQEGESSEFLRRMHINMGSSYLGCGGNYGQGMMGGGMMGIGSGMAGAYGVLGGLTWIVLITFLLAGIYFFIKQANKK